MRSRYRMAQAIEIRENPYGSAYLGAVIINRVADHNPTASRPEQIVDSPTLLTGTHAICSCADNRGIACHDDNNVIGVKR